ncbi:MAG: HupE/UreJ family protein [Burkholderiaceae bacterium]
MLRKLFFWVACLVAVGWGSAWAHDTPGESRVHALVKPDAQRLRVLVRLPLDLLLNIDLPKRGGPGFIDLAHVQSRFPAAIAATAKGIEFFEDGALLAHSHGQARISLPSDKSFESFELALASVQGSSLPESAEVFWNQGYFDVYLEYPVRNALAAFAMDFHVSPGMGDRLKLDARFVAPDGVVRAFEVSTAAGRIELDPRWHQAAWTFLKAGFAHILDGPDHLLFLLCLVIPFRRVGWTLVGVITAFTLAHSVTLIAAAYGVVPSGAWFAPLIELLIALSILYMAAENVFRPNLQRRWIVTFAFGMVHGFGFSFLLKSQLQFAGSHLLTSLLAFNVGIELGQLLVLGVVLPPLVWLFNRVSTHERTLMALVSLLVGHTAWHWMLERTQALRSLDWPSWMQARGPLALAVSLVVLAVALAWIVRERARVTPQCAAANDRS